MLIVLAMYFGIVWLVFSKLRLLPWSRLWQGVVYTVALIIALVVIGALNHTTPSGSVSVQGVVTSITPNVSGTVTEVAVKRHQAVSRGDVLFRIDRTQQAAEVARLEAALGSAKAAADQLQSDLVAAEAEIDALEVQLDFGIQRRDDIVRLQERGASTAFQMQEAVSIIDQVRANLRAAEARKASLDRRIAAQIDGVDVGVAEAEQALAQARWALEETVVVAPGDGIVVAHTLRPGNRVSTLRGAISFTMPSDRYLLATLPQSSIGNISEGDEIRVALGTMPGTEFTSVINTIPTGTGEGAVDLRSGLPTLRELQGTGEFLAIIAIPNDLPREALRLGASGTALVVTENAGAIAVLAEILFWISKMLNYL